MNIGMDIKIIRELLNMSQKDLAIKFDTTQDVINNWENNLTTPEEQNINKLYSFAFKNKVFINNIHEQLYKDEYTRDNQIVLYHGSKNKIEDQLSFSFSKLSNDFGKGFYLGETFEQASTYIAYSNSHSVYSYYLNTTGLKTIKFGVNKEWMFAIAYYRGWFDKYKDNKQIKDIINKIEDADVIIAPIADNRMFDLIDEFVNGMMTDLQCTHALSATNLGYQYVLKSDKALSQLKLIDELYLSEAERRDCMLKRDELNKLGLDKVKAARIEYKGKGKYIEEILK